MSVTLETVQIDFVSIIGRLHTEPIVLSQFAIWLDLKLAEYKAKGAISLECSGQSPDPIWLKGHNCAAKKITEGQTTLPQTIPCYFSTSNTGSAINSPCVKITNSSGQRQEPHAGNAVVVKEEVIDLSASVSDAGVFPVDLFSREDVVSNVPSRKRERTVTQSVCDEDRIIHPGNNSFHQPTCSRSLLPSLPKVRKVTSTSSCEGASRETVEVFPDHSNESLLSIIGTDSLEHEQNDQSTNITAVVNTVELSNKTSIVATGDREDQNAGTCMGDNSEFTVPSPPVGRPLAVACTASRSAFSTPSTCMPSNRGNTVEIRKLKKYPALVSNPSHFQVKMRGYQENTDRQKSRDKQRMHRQRIRRNEELFNLYKEREAIRMREYRLKKKDSETEDVKLKRREAAKLRQRKRRAILKQQGFQVKVEMSDIS